MTSADRLRKAAREMNRWIRARLSWSAPNRKMTPTRARIALGVRSKAQKTLELQSRLLALADAMDTDSVPLPLRGVSSRRAVECLFWYPSWPQRTLFEPCHQILSRSGIGRDDFEGARAALFALPVPPPATPLDQHRLAVQNMELRLVGVEYPGFYPTPAAVIERIVELVREHRGFVVRRMLEPSAGKGDLAEAMVAAFPDAALDCSEIVPELQGALRTKGLDVISSDCMRLRFRDYDVIAMNPPFEDAQDIKHVRHCYNMLRPGGVLVSVVGEGAFCRPEGIARAFRHWLDAMGAYYERLPPRSFGDGFRPTEVSARLVVMVN